MTHDDIITFSQTLRSSSKPTEDIELLMKSKLTFMCKLGGVTYSFYRKMLKI